MTVHVDYTAIEPTYHLVLERESAEFFVVVDRWNPDTVMMRSADVALCRRFMAAFAKREAATLDDASIQRSWRVAQSAPLPSNVLPFVRMHEALDEAS